MAPRANTISTTMKYLLFMLIQKYIHVMIAISITALEKFCRVTGTSIGANRMYIKLIPPIFFTVLPVFTMCFFFSATKDPANTKQTFDNSDGWKLNPPPS